MPRSKDEYTIQAQLYARYPEHQREIAFFKELPPEEKKQALRLGLQISMALRRLPPDKAAQLYLLLRQAQEDEPIPPTPSPSPAQEDQPLPISHIPPEAEDTQGVDDDPDAPRFNLFALGQE